MKVNKLGKSFGPAASFAGLLVFVAGLVACFSSPIGVLFALVGAFMAFSDERTSVDLAQRKVRYASYIFGVLPLGKWRTIEPEMGLVLKTKKRGFRVYSRSNRQLKLKFSETLLFLVDKNDKLICPLCLVDETQDWTEQKTEMATNLGIRTP